VPSGVHRLSPIDFRAIAIYVFGADPGKLRRALRSDRFSISSAEIVSSVEFVCDRVLSADNTMTVSEFARLHGIARRTLADWAASLCLRHFSQGNRKRFYIADLDAFLAADRRRG
jgi:excisionase family DNA binding protein